MTLNDLILAVKEQNLSKDKLESYRDQMSSLFAEMQLEMAEIEKSEALYMDRNRVVADIEMPVSTLKVMWKGTKDGQRLIVLKRYCLATKELLNSLKSRLYSIY